MKNEKPKLTRPMIEVLLHARRQGAVFPFPRADGGGARHKMCIRMARVGLLTGKTGPFPITDAGLKAIENLTHTGEKMSRFYLVAFDPDAVSRREAVLSGTEMQAFLRTCGDTAAVLAFKANGAIEVWRNQKHVTTCRSIGEVFAYAEKHGKGW